MPELSASKQIDNIISQSIDWRGDRLTQLRSLITSADHAVVEEVKWKMPSKPLGVPVWSVSGKMLCLGEILKNRVRLTFPKGALVADPTHLFNTRLNSRLIRAIDFYEPDKTDTAALTALIVEAIKISKS